MIPWRVIDVETHPAAMNMALDEAISNAVKIGKAKPTIRFYKWNPSAVSIGYFQGLHDEVDVSLCKELGVDIVRRRTGGGAVYHDAELTYSVIAPESLFPAGITESYHLICGWIVDALANVGITAEFKPINDVITGGKKISGNAQTRRNGILLQHGTILFSLDVGKMFSLLKVPKEKISDKFISDVKERVTSVSEQADVSEEQLKKALVDAFTANKKWELGTVSEAEMEEAKQLVSERYANDEWTGMR